MGLMKHNGISFVKITLSAIKMHYKCHLLHCFYVPGIKVITCTPYLACSTRSPSHHAIRPALVAPYTARPGRVANAQWLVTVIMRPVETYEHQ
jgi:hypothetical protein